MYGGGGADDCDCGGPVGYGDWEEDPPGYGADDWLFGWLIKLEKPIGRDVPEFCNDDDDVDDDDDGGGGGGGADGLFNTESKLGYI